MTDESLLSASKFVLFNIYFLLTFYLSHDDDEEIWFCCLPEKLNKHLHPVVVIQIRFLKNKCIKLHVSAVYSLLLRNDILISLCISE